LSVCLGDSIQIIVSFDSFDIDFRFNRVILLGTLYASCHSFPILKIDKHKAGVGDELENPCLLDLLRWRFRQFHIAV
jgi:hypothetical protein